MLRAARTQSYEIDSVELLEKEDMKKYDYLLQSPGIPHTGKIKMFMDETWRLFKEELV